MGGADSGGQAGGGGGMRGFFLERGTFALLALMLMVLGGVMAAFSLVKENYPSLPIPQALVSTEWPGADPASVEIQLTEKLERKIKGLEGLKRLRSASVAGYSLIAVEFRPEAGVENSMRRLREAVSQAMGELPPGAKRPVITKMSVNLTPILSINLYGKVPAQLMTAAARELKQRMERIKGVRKVELSGHRDEVIYVRLLPQRLVATGITAQEVVAAIRANHVDAPLGEIKGSGIGTQFRMLARFRTPEQLRRLPVGRVHGRVITLGEVAQVRRDLARVKVITRLSYKGAAFAPTVTLDVLRAPGANVLEVIERCKRVVREYASGPRWPAGLKYAVTSDESHPIINSLSSVINNGWQAMVIVFGMLLLALGWREAMVAGLAIPVTFLGVLGMLPAMGYTLNQMVIVGMVLALGLLVDNFILVMEGMHEAIARGKTPLEAVRETFSAYAVPAFSGTLTTILAMVPLAFIGGVDGLFIRVIPVTASLCLLVSYFVAMFVVLPLGRVVMRGVKPAPTPIDRLTARYEERFRHWLGNKVLATSSRRLAWVGAGVVLLAAAVAASGVIKVIMYPRTDSLPLGITVELPPETTLERADEVARGLGELLRAKPYLESVVAFTGKKSPMAKTSLGEELAPSTDTYLVGFSATFKPKDERDRLSFEYLSALRRELVAKLRQLHPGGVLTLHYAGTGPTSEDPVQVIISGRDMRALKAYAERVKEWLRGIRGAVDVRDNLGRPRVDVVLRPRREVLDFYGLSASDLAQELARALQGEVVGKIPTAPGEEEMKIRLCYVWPARPDRLGGPTRMSELATLLVPTPKGQWVPVEALVRVSTGEVPLVITHEAAMRTIVVSCKTSGRTASEIFEQLQSRLKASPPPAGMSWRFGGEAEASQEAYGSAGRMFAVAVMLVFAVLVLQTGSFMQPFVILLSLPMAFIGVVAAFLVAGMAFSFPAMIGLISLAGIAVNDAIVLVDTINRRRAEGMELMAAIAKGASERLRPVIVTSLTTITGLLPLMITDPMWRPLCLAIVGGITTSTIITLVLVPCLYALLLGGRVQGGGR